MAFLLPFVARRGTPLPPTRAIWYHNLAKTPQKLGCDLHMEELSLPLSPLQASVKLVWLDPYFLLLVFLLALVGLERMWRSDPGHRTHLLPL